MDNSIGIWLAPDYDQDEIECRSPGCHEPTDDVERVKDALVKADWDGPSSEEYWDYLAAAALSTIPIPAPTGDVVEQANWEIIARDAVAGLRYIEAHHGRLYGVGWDRVFNLFAALTDHTTKGDE